MLSPRLYMASDSVKNCNSSLKLQPPSGQGVDSLSYRERCGRSAASIPCEIVLTHHVELVSINTFLLELHNRNQMVG